MQHLFFALGLGSVAVGLQHSLQWDALDQDSFECPGECWQCCAAHAFRTKDYIVGFGTSENEFKCILKNASQLPGNYKCEDPTSRAHKSTTFKTYCSLNSSKPWWIPGMVDSTLRRRKTLSKLEHCETQSKLGKLAEYLWQKKSQFLNLFNRNMIEMGSIISAVRLQARKVPKVLPLNALSSIHPIDEVGAIEKTARRARAARTARSALDQSPFTLTRELIENHPDLKEFQSVTGFDVIKVAEGEYVTFEGNGRCVALLWAFPDGDDLSDRLNIEVSEFVIDDADRRNEIVQRITALQKRMGSKHFATMYPPSLDEERISEWAKGVKAELRQRMSKEP